MAVGKDKTRMTLTIPIKLKEILKQMAKNNDRDLNNLIIKILSDYVNQTINQGDNNNE